MAYRVLAQHESEGGLDDLEDEFEFEEEIFMVDDDDDDDADLDGDQCQILCQSRSMEVLAVFEIVDWRVYYQRDPGNGLLSIKMEHQADVTPARVLEVPMEEERIDTTAEAITIAYSYLQKYDLFDKHSSQWKDTEREMREREVRTVV